MSGELERQHPLVQLAASMPRVEVTSGDPDLIYMIGAFRRELATFQQSVAMGTVTTSERDRMVALLEDFAGVIRVTLGTQRIGEALEDGQP